MRYKDLFEKYTANNSYFKQYMKAGQSFDPYRGWHLVAEYLFRDHDLEDIQEWLGDNIQSESDLEDEEPELFYKLPDSVQKEIGDEINEYLLAHDPADAPSTAHMDYSKALPRTTWLVHFSDHASNIWYNGFKYGIDEMDRLGLTTWFSDSAKKHGGYNFAFEAQSRYASNAARQHKYGREAVLFQNAGVKCWHHGDEEDQVVFWGMDVEPKDIIYLAEEYGDWCVKSRHDLNNGSDVLYRSENFENCVKWVMAHHTQYRKYLYGNYRK